MGFIIFIAILTLIIAICSYIEHDKDTLWVSFSAIIASTFLFTSALIMNIEERRCTVATKTSKIECINAFNNPESYNFFYDEKGNVYDFEKKEK